MSEVSRVYPTADLYDLFEEFPNGFTITQTRFTENGIIIITLVGDAETQTISGDLAEREHDADVTRLQVTYQEGEFIFSDEAKAKELWPMQAFLFQTLTLDKAYLSSLKTLGGYYSFENGMFEIHYEMNNDLINRYLEPIGGPADLPLSIHGSDSNRGYYFTVVFEDGPFSFGERVDGTEK